MSAKCSRCGTLENKHSKDCYEAMILGWALGIEERPAAQPVAAVEARPQDVAQIKFLLTEVEDRNRQLRDLRRQLAEASTAAPSAKPEPEPAPEESSSPEPVADMTVSQVQAAARDAGAHVEFTVEPTPAEILAENVRDLLGEQAAAEWAASASAEEPAPAPAAAPLRMKTPTTAVDIWLNEEAVASNDDDARIIVATAADVYAAWAADKPDMPKEASALTVAKALKARGYKRRAPLINGRQYPCYYGVRLRTPEQVPDGSIRVTRPDDEVAIVERFVTVRTRPSAEPDALVPVGEMYGSFQRWCERTGQTDIGSANFSTCMQQLGAYEKGIPWSGPNKKTLGYLGAELTPEPLAGTKPNEVPDNQTIRKAIAAAREAARKVQEEREAAAAKAAEPAPVTYRVKEAEPEAKPDNNGWGKTFDTTDVTVPELSVEDVLAEHPEVEPRGGYSGPRPGPGDQLPQETRDLINAILNLDEGWSFVPAEGGNAKTYLVAPDGSRFRQAATFGGGRGAGRVGNNRELRRYLSKKGMLPTAAAPFSQLTSASTKPAPKKAAKSTVTVISRDGQARTPQEWVKVEAEPEAKPLTEEEMDKALFDLYMDVRSGYDGAFGYHPDVESLQGLNKDEISTAVRQPERVEVRPESKAKGYPVIKFSRGDVNVVMGYRDRKSPAVIRAEWGWLLGHSQYQIDRHGGGGSKGSSGNSLPNTFAQLAGRLKIAGAEVTPNADGKTAVVSYKGQELGLVTKEKCPRATTHSDWNRMTRKIAAIDRRELAAV